jgi:hypothetical protein
MPEQKNKSRNRGRAKRTYVHRPNAIHITLYSPHGDPVPRAILNEATEVVTQIAVANGLLVGLADT